MAKNIDIPNGWEVKKLGEVVEKSFYGTSNPTKKNGKYPVLKMANLDNGKVVLSNIEFIDLTDEEFNKIKLIKDDILFNRTNSEELVGKIAIFDLDINCVAASYIVIFRINQNISLPLYLNFLLNTDIYKNNVKQFISKGVSQCNINQNTLQNHLNILLPPLAEQEKIAEILSLWDKAIEQTKELIAYKEKQKKGLMQKYIYPTKNKISYRIGKLFNLSRGRVISKQEIEENQGIYPVYSSQTSNNGILGFINTYDYDDELITWTTDGANAGKVFTRKGQFNCTNVCGIAIPKNRDLCNLVYVTSFLNNITKKYVSYVGNPKLMNNVFEEIEIYLPPLDEQKAIADILCKADEEIELLNKQLDLYTEQKKGLMQNLLTGKVRVKV